MLTNSSNFFMRKWRTEKPSVYAAVAVCWVALWIAYTLFERHVYIKSDNAIVQGNYGILGSEVDGFVAHVLLDSPARVKRGQLLAQIDARSFRARLDAVLNESHALRVNYETTRRDFARANVLFRGNAITRQAYDQADFAAKAAAQNYIKSEADIAQARIDLWHTQIFAPADGVIASRVAQPGMHVKSGDPLFTFVKGNERWIYAKIKETDLADVKLNREVKVSIDAFPHREFQGHVTSIGPTAEAPFAAIPPDNAAGNFNKYVQWVPIRVDLALNGEDPGKIAIGLSSEMSMRRH